MEFVQYVRCNKVSVPVLLIHKVEIRVYLVGAQPQNDTTNQESKEIEDVQRQIRLAFFCVAGW